MGDLLIRNGESLLSGHGWLVILLFWGRLLIGDENKKQQKSSLGYSWEREREIGMWMDTGRLLT